MPSGRPNHVIFNLGPVALPPDTEVSLETLKEARLLHISGKSRKLPLKILAGNGWAEPRVYRAAAFSEAAIEAIETAGGEVVLLPPKQKWTREGAAAKKAAEAEAAAQAAADRAAAWKARREAGKSPAREDALESDPGVNGKVAEDDASDSEKR